MMYINAQQTTPYISSLVSTKFVGNKVYSKANVGSHCFPLFRHSFMMNEFFKIFMKGGQVL